MNVFNMNVWLFCCLGVVSRAVTGLPATPDRRAGSLQHEQQPYENDLDRSKPWSRFPNNHDRQVLSIEKKTKNNNISHDNQHGNQQKRQQPQFSCTPLSPGLLPEDCAYMAAIGMLGQGPNPQASSSPSPPPPFPPSQSTLPDSRSHDIWIGTDGPNRFTFVNGADVPIVLVLWHTAPYDNQASFMNARVPAVSYSLPQTGDAVAVSVANDVPGGWAALYNRSTPLSEYGQISNTFGEFSTGAWATIDVSRMVNMSGDPMTIRVKGIGTGAGSQGTTSGCVSDMGTCVYTCNDGEGNSCGGEGTYSLLNCTGQPDAVQSADSDGNPTGGCQGWSFGGDVDIVMWHG